MTRAPSSPSEDYLAVLAGQRQWIATTNFAGCPSRPPDSFANSAVLTTSAKFLMRWAGPSARAFLCRLTPKRNSLSRSRGEFDRPLGEGVVTVGLGDSAGNGAADADVGVLSWESLGARAAGEGSIGRTCGSTSPPHAESAIRSTMIPTRSHAILKLVGLFTSGRCGRAIRSLS